MVLWCSLLLAPASALEPGPQPLDADTGFAFGVGDMVEPEALPVVGGSQVERGDWDSVVLVVGGGGSLCTGTVIGPRVVLTAAHCVTSGVAGILYESKDYARQQGLYTDNISRIESYGNRGYDVAVVILGDRAPVEASPLALDCVLPGRLEDGASAWMVGFGATRADGRGGNSALNEAPTTIVDHDCSQDRHEGTFMGCIDQVRPGGEVAGFTEDAHVCYGDSGGPLFLRTREGPYVVGVASRLFAGSPGDAPCSDGSIWVRPDAVIDWIDEVTGNLQLELPSCNEAPYALVPEMLTVEDEPVTVVADGDDPDGDISELTWDVGEPASNGEVSVSAEGAVTYIPEPGFVGEDSFTVVVTDAGTPRWARTAPPLSTETVVSVLVEERGCGCASNGGLAPGAALALLLPLALVRRRTAA